MAISNSLNLRCLLEQEGRVFVGHCIDLGLSVQASSVEDVKLRLHSAIEDYLARISELCQQGETEAAVRLMSRKAPLDIRLRYLLATLKSHFRRQPKVGAWAEQLPDPLVCA
jgi:hypothetical protein